MSRTVYYQSFAAYEDPPRPTGKIPFDQTQTLPTYCAAEYDEHGRIASFEKIYVELAEQYKIPEIPFLLEGVGGVKRLMQQDSIHPTAEGNAIVGKTVFRYLEPMLTK